MILWIFLVVNQLAVSAGSSTPSRAVRGNVTEVFEVMSLYSDEPPSIESIARELFRIYQPFCWRRTYGRGAGHPLNACPADQPDKSGLLCYPRCRDGYIGVGPVCWQDCGNLRTVGIFCVGTTVSFRLSSKRATLLNRRSSSDFISEENDEFSYTIIFVRKSYGRGAGSPMICSSEYEQNGALCYKWCDKRYVGVGPVCWQSCSAFQPVSCGAGCATTAPKCARTIFNMAASITDLLVEIFGPSLVYSAIANIIASATVQDWPLVSNYILKLAEQLTEKVLIPILRKFINWPESIVEGITKNTTALVIVSAFNNTASMAPFIKLFHLDGIIDAFDWGLCDLPDELLY